MAKLIGALLGFLFFGGFFGALLGYFVGGFFGRGLQSNLQDSYTLHAQSADIFFETTFSLMGHMAKADGRVSEDEIAQAEALMARMGMDESKRKEAIYLFKEGTGADYDMQATLSRFVAASRFRGDLKRNLIMFLVEIAIADGEIHINEEDMLRRVANAINIDADSFEKMLEMLKAQRTFGGGAAGRASTADELANAYQALGVVSTASDKDIKKAYRKLMSQYHPDKMIAKGVPEDMLAMATEKTQEIQSAYEVIKNSRK